MKSTLEIQQVKCILFLLATMSPPRQDNSTNMTTTMAPNGETFNYLYVIADRHMYANCTT